MPTDRTREKPPNYQGMKVEVLRALIFVLQQETEALSEGSIFGDNEEFRLSEVVQRFEARLIRAALARTGGRRRRAAHLLGMKVPTLIAKIQRYNINIVEIIKSEPRESVLK